MPGTCNRASPGANSCGRIFSPARHDDRAAATVRSARLCPLYMRLLQGADPSEGVAKSIPSDLGEYLRRNNGDLSALKDAAKRAPASAHRPLKGLKYALPVTTPGKVICLGLNYLDHVKEGSQRDNIPKFPTVFMRGNSSLVPHGQPIIRPKASETLDYEAELIFIVGKRAKHLTLED